MQTRPVQISVYRDQIRTILAAVVTRIGHAQHPLLPSPPSSPSIHALFSYCCTCSLVAPALSRLTLIIVPRCLQRLLQNEHPTASVLCGQHLNHRTTSILFYAFFYTLSVEVFLFFFGGWRSSLLCLGYHFFSNKQHFLLPLNVHIPALSRSPIISVCVRCHQIPK